MEKLGKLILSVACVALFAVGSVRGDDPTVTVDPSANWIGYMNVFDIPQNEASGPYPSTGPGTYMFGSAWGTADLMASFADPVLTLGPNTIVTTASQRSRTSAGCAPRLAPFAISGSAASGRIS